MIEKTTLSLWLKPDGRVYDELAGIIADLSRKHGSPVFDPHVTLLGGLNAPADIILGKLDQITQHAKPVDVQLGKIGFKDNLFQSFFARVENDDILSLRRPCEQAFGNPMMEDFMPHLSLMYHELPEKEKETLAEELGGRIEYSFQATQIHLVSTAGDPEEWKEIKTQPLNG